MISFNLVDEAWVPVNMMNGNPELMSLNDVFHNARTIKSIEGDNPMQTAAITRLVLAILYRSVCELFLSQRQGDSDVELWGMLWNDKEDNLSRMSSEYLKTWHKRFELFDARRPFFQIANLEYSTTNENVKLNLERQSLGRIMPESDKISVFRKSAFDVKVDYAESARILVAYQSWSTTSTMSPVKGVYPEDEAAIPRLYPKGHKGWCSSIGVTTVVGRNLYETLLLNLVPSTLKESDKPFWEEKSARKVPVLFRKNDDGVPEMIQRKPKPEGPVQLFTWFAKSVMLIPENGKVVGAIASEHNSLGRSSDVPSARFHEVQSAWKENKGGEISALHFTHDSVWSDLPALLPQTGKGFIAPLNVTWCAKVTNLLGINLPVRVRIIGAKMDDKNQTFRGVIDKSIPISSISLLEDAEVSSKINDTSRLLNKMRYCYTVFAKDVLSISKKDPEDVDVKNFCLPVDDELNRVFRDMLSNINEGGHIFNAAVLKFKTAVTHHSMKVLVDVSPEELIGSWRTNDSGERVVASAAHARHKLLKKLEAIVPSAPQDAPQVDGGGILKWALSKSIPSDIFRSQNPSYAECVAYDVWSNNKKTVEGKKSHKNEKRKLDSFLAMASDHGMLFDSRVIDVFNNEIPSEEVMSRLVGVMVSRGLQIDFVTLSELIDARNNKEKLINVAEQLVDRASKLI